MGTTRWLNEEELRAWQGLQLMQHRLDGELARQLATNSGLSYQDYTVLVGLTSSEGDSLRLYELGQFLGWEKSRLSHHITRMVNRGLVAKQRCDTDGRGWTVLITELGQQEIEAAAPGHAEAVRELFIDRLSPAQLESVATAAEIVLAGLEDKDDCQ